MSPHLSHLVTRPLTRTSPHLSHLVTRPLTRTSPHLSHLVTRPLTRTSPHLIYLVTSSGDENDPVFEVSSHMPKQWDELNHALQSVLPPNYTYLVEQYEELPTAGYSGAPKRVSKHTFG